MHIDLPRPEGNPAEKVVANVAAATEEPRFDPRATRPSISAEAYGDWNKRTEFEPRATVKSEDQRRRLRGKLSDLLIFSALERREIDTVVSAIEERRLEMGETVFRQGDEGCELFIVESGTLVCTRKFVPSHHVMILHRRNRQNGL